MKISLVVPVLNEAETIEDLLITIAAQARRPDEVIIVDGGSTDATRELVESWIRRKSGASVPVRLLSEARATPGRGRNVGIQASNHEWVALTDAGITLERTWLAELEQAAMEDPDASMVFGHYEPLIESLFTSAAALVYVAPRQARSCGLMRAPFIASSMVRRDVWQAVGGFPDLRAAEDLIFMEKVGRAGYHVAWACRAIVRWRLQPDFLSTFARFRTYSFHNVVIGRQGDWLHGIARQYLAVGLAVMAVAQISGAAAILVAATWLASRVGVAAWRRRRDHAVGHLFHPARLVLAVSILLVIDAATLCGWVMALGAPRRDPSRRDLLPTPDDQKTGLRRPEDGL